MGWPLSQDYNEAIQSPAESFADDELRTGEAVTNALGIPMPRSGNFADVYEVRCPNGSRWAVKCFTREVRGLRERYQEISRALQQARLPFTVEFSYLERGMRIRSDWFPVLKMQWVEGFTLNEFVRQNVEKPAMLGGLLQIWGRMATRLREAGIAHADLQHGNVLLVPGSTATSLAVKLIDYDGMFVPSLSGKKSGEVGHPCYQHPQRLREGTYSFEVDRFPLLLVAASLRCLESGGRDLWEAHDNGDNLLFRETDLKSPRDSGVFRALDRLADPGARSLVARLREALSASLESAPLLDEVLPGLKPVVPTPSPAALQTAPTPRTAPPPAPAAKTSPAKPPAAAPATPPGATTTARSRPEAPARAPVADDVDDDVDEVEVAGKDRSRGKRSKKRRKKGRTNVALWAGGGVALAVVACAIGFWALRHGGSAKADPSRDADEKQALADKKDAPKPPREEPQKRDDEKPKDPPADGPKDMPSKDPANDVVADKPKPDKPIVKLDPVNVRMVRSAPSPHRNRAVNLCVSPDARSAVSAGIDPLAVLWTLGNRPQWTRPAGGLAGLQDAWVVDLSPDGKRLLSGTPKGDVTLWNLENRTEELHLPLPSKTAVHRVAVSSDVTRAAFVTTEGIAIWDLTTQKEIRFNPVQDVYALRFLPGSRRLVSTATRGVRLWDGDTGAELHRFGGFAERVECLAVSADGKRAAAGSRDNRVHVVDLEALREVYVSEAMPIFPATVAISPAGLLVASNGDARTHCMWFWDLATGQERGRFTGPDYIAHIGLSFAADGQTLIGLTGGESWQLRFWQVEAPGRSPDPVKDPVVEKPDRPVDPSGKSELTLRLAESIKAHTGNVEAVCVADGLQVFSHGDGVVKRWALDDGKFKEPAASVRDPQAGLTLMAVSPDGKTAIGLANLKTLHPWSLDRRTNFPVLAGHTSNVRTVCFSPDGTRVVSTSHDGTARVWELRTGRTTAVFRGHSRIVADARFLPDGKRVLSTGWEGSMRLWDAATGEELRVYEGVRDNPMHDIAITPDGKRAATFGGGRIIRIWEIETGRELHKLTEQGLDVRALAISPEGKMLAAFSSQPQDEIHIWDMETGKLRAKLSGKDCGGWGLAFLDEQTLVAGGRDANLRRWRIEGPGAPTEVRKPPTEVASPVGSVTLRQTDLRGKGHRGKISGISVTSDGRVVSGAWDGAVYVWNLRAGMKELRHFQISADPRSGIVNAVLTPDEKSVLVAEALTLRLIDLEKGKATVFVDKHTDLVHGLDVSSDGSLAVSGCLDKFGHIWDLKKGKELVRFSGHNAGLIAARFFPDGKRVVTAGSDRSLRIWEARTGKELLRIDGNAAERGSLAVSPDGTKVVCGWREKMVSVSDTSTGKELYKVEEFPNFVYSVAVSPDGRLGVASAFGGAKSQLRVWDMATGTTLAKYEGDKFMLDVLTFSPDGKFLLGTDYNDNGVIQVWEVVTGP
jgi:WD40 repeat protein